MSTDPERPQDADLEDTGLGPADHADPHHPVGHRHEGYEGEGLGPSDHARHESTNPDTVAGREGYEGEGLGPRDHAGQDPLRPADEDYEHEGLGPFDHARHLGDDEQLED